MLFRSVFGMLNWAFMWYQAAKDGPVEVVAGEMLALILGGVGGRPAAVRPRARAVRS